MRAGSFGTPFFVGMMTGMLIRLVLLCCVASIGCSSKQQSGATSETDVPAAQENVVQPKTQSKASRWQAHLSRIDKVVYRFQDASVPPPDHRSYTITVTPNEISKVVDSYGDIVSEQANAINAGQFQALLAGMEALGIESAAQAEGEERGCTGGTSDSLQVYAGNEQVLAGTAASCGGDVSGTIVGDVRGVAKLAEEFLLPSADEVVAPR